MKAGFARVGQGSSKDLYVATAHPGRVFFDFSDRVSVFDYGALPDPIPGKGEALARSARHFFALFEREGLATAFDAKLSAYEGHCALRSARHPKFPSATDSSTELEFIPLEVIFRWGVPQGSSLLKRRPDLKVGERFAEPLVEFSTKLETSDRLLQEEEAEKLAGSFARLGELRAYAIQAAQVLRNELKRVGLELWDGKVECAWDSRQSQVVLVDAITLDELRVTLPGLESIPLSKELLRQWIGGTNWAFRVLRAKAGGAADWKHGLPKPPRLGAWRLEKLAQLYKSFADSLEAGTVKPLLDWSRRDTLAPKVFVLGGGGREAALRWRLKREGCDIVEDPQAADAVWVSQDADLDAGRVDAFEGEGLWAYGPLRASAQLESSKLFGKRIAERAGVKLPRSTEDLAQLKSFEHPPVVKFDGLAAGKGVIVPLTWAEAEDAVAELKGRGRVFLEERIHGPEASAFFAVETGYNGVKTRFLGTARDFKRRFPHNEGPNTGGMGAYAPHPDLTPADTELFASWAQATAEALAAEGLAYNGVLYIGALKDEKRGWMLLEYNARFGDPETEALVCAWDEGPVLRSILKLDLRGDARPAAMDKQALCLALVRHEYPFAAPPIDLPPWQPSEDECVLFRTQSLSGRVAFLVGRGTNLGDAGDRVFGTLVKSPWKTLLDWRQDILS